MRFPERLLSVGGFNEMVEGAEQKNGISRGRLELNPPGVPYSHAPQGRARLGCGRPYRFLDMSGYRVAEVDIVSFPRQPKGIAAGRAADVEDGRRRLGQIPEDDLLRPQKLQPPQSSSQSSALVRGRIKIDDVSYSLIVLRDCCGFQYHDRPPTPRELLTLLARESSIRSRSCQPTGRFDPGG